MSESRELKLEASWKARVGDWFARDDMQALSAFLRERRAAGARIHPAPADMFAAFDATPFDEVKVVILGQDPYHGPGQAHGLSFSVLPGVPVPPSLANIYKELASDTGFIRPDHGYLMPWAQQGVLLLNSVLTVEMSRAASHQGKGWELFTDAVIRLVAQQEKPVVFLLWGAYAQRKAGFVDQSRHLVLKSAHPSPLSAHNGFLGSRPFSQANAFLEAHGRGPIDWALPPIEPGGRLL